MSKGKYTCKILKDIRRQIAEANDIEYITSECQYQGDCPGTCPKCEAEVRYLEQELERKQVMGKSIAILGVSAGLVAMGGGLASCNNNVNNKETVQQTISDTLPATKAEEDTLFVQAVDTPLVVAKPTKVQKNKEIVEEFLMGDIAVENDVTETEDIFLPGVIAESMPEFPGGMDECMRFIKTNLRYPNADVDAQGRVVVEFTVKIDGSIGDAHVVRSLHPLFDQEALRIVNSMPKWQPGEIRGNRVEVKYTLPIMFTTR